MPSYTFRLPTQFSGYTATVFNTADVQQTTGTTDASGNLTVDLAVGDYYAKVSYGYTSYRASGEVDRGDADATTPGGLSATYAGISSTVSDFAAIGSRLQAPQFTRVGTTPKITPAIAGSPTVYWPSVQRMDTVLGGAALDRYYIYVSTDHDSVGGIYLITAPTPLGPYTARGRVFLDTTSGIQTETPCVVWNEVESLFFMYYQQQTVTGANGQQTTLLATSPDGAIWTRVGIAIDVPSANDIPGNGHTGYATVGRLGQTWFARTLCGGGNNYHDAISYSNDGRTWQMDPRLMEGQMDFASSTSFKLGMSAPFLWRGQMWCYGWEGAPESGVAVSDRKLVIGTPRPDLRGFATKPTPLLTLNQNWETTNYRSAFMFPDGNKLYFFYQTDQNIGVAVATA